MRENKKFHKVSLEEYLKVYEKAAGLKGLPKHNVCCANCRHWSPDEEGSDFGPCEVKGEGVSILHPSCPDFEWSSS